MRSVLFWFAVILGYSRALECGIDIKGSEEQLKDITNVCLSGNKAVVYGTPLNGSEDNNTITYTTTEPNRPTTFRPEQHRRKTRQSSEEEDSNERGDVTTEISNSTVRNTNKTSSNTKNCVVQCVLQRIGMTDANGYPEHHRILEGLLKTAEGRELRDFLQDSTDECFKVMQQADTLDSCTYSGMLVTCLAEKGRSNCGDWPVGKLPFH